MRGYRVAFALVDGVKDRYVRMLRHVIVLSLVAIMCAACASGHRPINHDLLSSPEKSANPEALDRRGRAGEIVTGGIKDRQCAPAGTPQFIATQNAGLDKKPIRAKTMRYSPGDRISIQIPGSTDFNGDYMINPDGKISLPFAGDVPAAGQTNDELIKTVEKALVTARLFQPNGFRVSVRPLQYSAINVTVNGAVFVTGRYLITARDERTDKYDKSPPKYGDYPMERNVAGALRSAGGIRPDADLTNIRLIRAGKVERLDWQGALTGAPVDDVVLMDGDHLEVGEGPCHQSALVRPSQITPPVVRIFMSNLVVPSQSNTAAAVSKESWHLPYGSRLLQGLVAANCVGGSLASNAGRHGVLISRNPKTHRTEVIQRSVEQLVLSPDRDTINPFLMPEDSIACYDSAVTDLREIAATINSLVMPRATWRAN